ncbi:MAG: cation diffusion facilitator family transporter [Microbacteriaceae bacterium]|nr:cation diffusion facilitator family transporter [Microbacteriaceae bacterium]
MISGVTAVSGTAAIWEHYGRVTRISLTVVIALGANLLVAIAKTVASVITGSASMVAESAHSWADFGNEIFLLVADSRSARVRDTRHPLGYGREAYVWSMFAAFGIFTAGAVVSVWHGVQELFEPGRGTDYAIAYIVLAVSFVLEGFSFRQAYRQARAGGKSRGTSTARYALTSSNATLRAVFAEDAAALVGLLLAFLGILLHQLTGLPAFDSIGSILVGVLLAVVAIVLIDRNRRFLVGESPDVGLRDEVLAKLLASPAIDRVTYLHLEFVGPGRIFLVAAIDMKGDDTEAHVARALRAVERQIEVDEHIEEAVLTLSTPDEPSLSITGG